MFSRPATLALAVVILGAIANTSSVSGVGPAISTRIERLGVWLEGQLLTAGQTSGFAHGVGTNSTEMRLLIRDNAIAALALVAYRETMNSERFDPELRAAISFLLKAQTSRNDFYEYLDPSTNSWRNSGRLYTWNAYAIMALGYAAYHMAFSVPSERAYWLTVGRAAEETIDSWKSTNLDDSGGWALYEKDKPRTMRVDDNGAILVGLSYIALLEEQYGNSAKAGVFSGYAQSVAGWIISQQETNRTSWGFGGLYTDVAHSAQDFAANCLAFFGINSYYKIIELLTPTPSPSTTTVRSSMVDWMDSYVNAMVDVSWGPFFTRTNSGKVSYPKLVATSGWLMRAAADIWINIGTQIYQNRTGWMYEWLTGVNELKQDLQSSANRLGDPGGFVKGIEATGMLNETDAFTSTSAMLGLLHGDLISIPEYDGATIGILTILILSTVIVSTRRLRRNRRSVSL